MPPLALGTLHGARRSVGGARHEASERVVLRAGAVEFDGWTLNQSRGGLRVVVEERVELGAEYAVEMSGKSPRRARVVWLQDEADGQVAGLEYLDLTASDPEPETP